MSRLTYLVALPLILVGLAAPPATADESFHADPTRDVIDRENLPPYTETIAPGDRQRDIKLIRTTYADQKVQVTIELRELGAGYYNYTRILVPDGGSYIVSNHDEPGTAEDSVDLFYYAPGAGARRGDPPIACVGLKAVRIPAKDRIRTVVPRACLGSPGSVRTGALMHTFLDNGHARMDDARRDGDVVPTDLTRTRVGGSVAYN